MRSLVYTVFIVISLLVVEAVLAGMLSGFLFISFTAPLFENPGLYITMLGDNFAGTARLILVENPLFVIQSQHMTSGATHWSLHYYSITLLVHALVAYLLADKLMRDGMDIQLRSIPVLGNMLLLISSLYLMLAACCTAGPNWIVHTWILSLVLEPATASGSSIDFYQGIKGWFLLLQIGIGVTGMYLVLRDRDNFYKIKSLIHPAY